MAVGLRQGAVHRLAEVPQAALGGLAHLLAERALGLERLVQVLARLLQRLLQVLGGHPLLLQGPLEVIQRTRQRPPDRLGQRLQVPAELLLQRLQLLLAPVAALAGLLLAALLPRLIVPVLRHLQRGDHGLQVGPTPRQPVDRGLQSCDPLDQRRPQVLARRLQSAPDLVVLLLPEDFPSLLQLANLPREGHDRRVVGPPCNLPGVFERIPGVVNLVDQGNDLRIVPELLADASSRRVLANSRAARASMSWWSVSNSFAAMAPWRPGRRGRPAARGSTPARPAGWRVPPRPGRGRAIEVVSSGFARSSGTSVSDGGRAADTGERSEWCRSVEDKSSTDRVSREGAARSVGIRPMPRRQTAIKGPDRTA